MYAVYARVIVVNLSLRCLRGKRLVIIMGTSENNSPRDFNKGNITKDNLAIFYCVSSSCDDGKIIEFVSTRIREKACPTGTHR